MNDGRTGVGSLILGLACALGAVAAGAAPGFAAGDRATVIEGRGFVTDATHPVRPGDFRRHDVRVLLLADRALGETVIEVAAVATAAEAAGPPDRWYVRRGRIFQVDDRGAETTPRPLGDLSAATVAALHPGLVRAALADRPENAHDLSATRRLFAWNGALWTLDHDPASGRIGSLSRATFDEVHGDASETVRYEAWAPEAGPDDPDRVRVSAGGRDLAVLEFTGLPSVPLDSLRFPAGDRRRDATRVLAPREVRFTELAPRVFAADLDTLNTRVVVAEFEDHVFVIEGAYDPRASDVLVAAVRERFARPARWFAFSHLHGQYVAGTRSWVAAGATIVVPPTTVPLVVQIARARFDSRPDALARSPRPLRVEAVAERRRFADAANELVVLEVDSDHTDEYFLFWFPRQRLLVTGDLFFFREGRKATGRSKTLCATVARLGLAPRRVVATWPLHGYGTKSVISGEEFSAACSATP